MKCSILNVDIDVVTFDMIENVTNYKYAFIWQLQLRIYFLLSKF